MKIKQTTKMIILVVALVSVIGVGAVSFAAWTGGVPSITASASVGQVALYGFVEENNGLTQVDGVWTWGGLSGTLVPYDQDGEIGSQTKIISVQLPKYIATAAAEITIQSETGLKLYAQLGEEALTAAPSAIDNTWTQITSTGAVLSAPAGTAANEYVVSGQFLSIILDSSVLSEMNQTIALTISVALAA